ncbi:MAG: DUF1993 family protein [Congregibacter sp.]
MSVSLQQISIEPYVQMLDALCGMLDKGQQYCDEKNQDANALLDLRLADDMHPMRFQLHMATYQSDGALQGIRDGVFTPPKHILELDYAGFRKHIAEIADKLRVMEASEIDTLSYKPLVFKLGELEIPFNAEGFVLSFSLPNLYFHTTTAYALLRMHGVPLGKIDFLGQLKVSQP